MKQGIVTAVQGRRQKLTYHLSKKDEAIIFDCQLIEGQEATAINPLILQMSAANDTPSSQLDDSFVDVHLTRWGYYRALSHKKRMISDPAYRTEQALRIQNLPHILTRLETTTLESNEVGVQDSD